jgi:aminoglycoside/choline kinase family phosphotransferase
MTLASGAPLPSPPSPTLTYADQSLAQTPLEVRCDELLPAWSALLEPMYGAATMMRVSHIATGGSDRSFYRVEPLDGRVSVVMCVTPSRTEFAHYIAIGQFLKERDLPVPALHAWSDTTGLAILQDAGRQALQHVVLEHGADAEVTFEAYRRVVRTLGALQSVPAEACCPEMSSRPFSHTDLRWETDYFRENFLGRQLGWDLSTDAVLTAEFEALAGRVLEVPYAPMHRDFQSQNVFLEGEQVWILDFQGARLGPLPYDLASLLRDPYVSLPAEVEHQLLMYYYGEAMPLVDMPWSAFRELYALVSLQRLMQALGAYGFLGLVKGKPWFRKWMAPALALLQRAVGEVDGLPRLRAVVGEACERLARCEFSARA